MRVLRGGSRWPRETRTQGETQRRVDFDDVGFLGEVPVDVNPADMAPWGEVIFECEAVVPLTLPRRDDRRPCVLGRDGEVDVPRSRLHEASRATVWTSFTPSSFSIRRESCASESISTVVDTTAVLSSYTCTSSADMFTRFSATTVAMSRIRPCRSHASILIATG